MSDRPSTPDSQHPVGTTSILARAVQGGDNATFQDLFERVMPALQAWVELQLRGGRNRSFETQDVLQEVWLRALQKFESFDRGRSFRPWMLGIAKNVLFELYKNRSTRPLRSHSSEDSESLPETQVPDGLASIGTRMAKDDSIRRFLEFVDGLDPEEQAILIYCGIEGYSCTQAASRLMITPDAAGKRWRALRSRIRENSSIEALAQAILE